jgi:starch phosphorylase
MALGRLHGNDQNEDFNMAYLAIRGCGAINGVSRLHGEVCRQIFSSLFPRWPLHEVPVGHVTNGVHIPTWSSAETNKLWKDCCGKRFWEAATTDLESAIGKISDEQIWALRSSGRQATINYARERLASQLAERGADSDAIEAARRIFDPETLILGFARRFATYKRPNMLLFDKERFLRLLKSQCRPVQLIIAGKAHPADLPGQALIREWAQFISLPEVRPHVIFLEDYNMSVTEQLVRGVDVWLNTPRRPWEACGTSGMKVLANGGLNLSELDGWWAEAYTPDVGWALDGTVEASPADVDRLEAERLYTLLEEQVIPEFYNRDSQGLPARWIARIRKSMASLTPQYSAHRAVKQYAEELYVPAAQAYHRRAEHQGALASQIDEWKRAVSLSWPAVRFVTFAVDTREDYHHFELQVYLDNLPKGAASVELYSEEQVYAMECVGPLAAANTFLYHVAVPATVAVKLFTPRIVPYNSALEIPLEAAHIHWLQ